MHENLRKYEHGQVSFLPEDEKRVRDKALAEGKNPDEAVKVEREKMARATERIQEAHKEAQPRKARVLLGNFEQKEK
ncbi:MAG: hypothetical protein HY434_01275 [Candidatus Liptonbacteria bacterium]|nr:hypothetical protein [Candidatus Liptonbacteria bacterium]